MHILRAPYLLYPVLFLGLVFLLDKVFLIPEVRDNFIQPGGMLYYRQRDLQINRLHNALPELPADRRVAVVFGDSRSFAIGDMTNVPLLEEGPDFRSWIIYNFAGPQAVPAYHTYLAERIFQGPQRPGYAIVGISPDAFNRRAGIFGSPVMTFGLSREFIERYWSQVPAQDRATYTGSRRFALTGMNFSFRGFWERLRGGWRGAAEDSSVVEGILLEANHDPASFARSMPLLRETFENAATASLDLYSLEHSPQRKLLDLARGAQYLWFGRRTDQELEQETTRLVNFYIKNFTVSQEQFFFFELMLERLQRSGVRVVVFWPRVNAHLQAAYEDEPQIQSVWRRIEQLTARYGARAINLNTHPDMRCSDFYDASHLSVHCFPDVQRILLRALR
ncbi:MAG: DUF1574 family protein [Spirochaetales bacterium]|nr:DUF1574 family protein [Leptospiraceae bacterium]MCP5483276.1 DUF1574 family protein [Spirochaetales bacterium]